MPVRSRAALITNMAATVTGASFVATLRTSLGATTPKASRKATPDMATTSFRQRSLTNAAKTAARTISTR